MSAIATARAGVIDSIREVIAQELACVRVYNVSVPPRGRETTGMREAADDNVRHAYEGLDESLALYEKAIKENTEL